MRDSITNRFLTLALLSSALRSMRGMSPKLKRPRPIRTCGQPVLYKTWGEGAGSSGSNGKSAREHDVRNGN